MLFVSAGRGIIPWLGGEGQSELTKTSDPSARPEGIKV